jgi:hypothetical protein
MLGGALEERGWLSEWLEKLSPIRSKGGTPFILRLTNSQAMIRSGGYVFSPMKLKAFVLTAGLIALGANAAWASHPSCKTNLDGQVRYKGDKCTSKSYKFNSNSKCTCPGDKPNATKKCEYRYYNPPVYSCEVP